MRQVCDRIFFAQYYEYGLEKSSHDPVTPASHVLSQFQEAVFRSQCVAGTTRIAHHHNIVGAALANNLARMAWAALAKGEVYRPPELASSLACR